MKIFKGSSSTEVKQVWFSMAHNKCYTDTVEASYIDGIAIGTIMHTCGVISGISITNRFLPKERLLPALCAMHNIPGISINVPVRMCGMCPVPLCKLIQSHYLSGDVVNE